MAGDNFDEFYKDLKETEKKDSTLTPKQQIDRLLRPGSTYRNLNPYEVLQIDPELPLDEVKKKYRRLSILVSYWSLVYFRRKCIWGHLYNIIFF